MSVQQTVRILVCTGHTGGHFFPALSFSETFHALYPETEIHFLINRLTPFSEALLKRSPFPVYIAPLVPPPNFFSFKMIPFLLRCVIAFWKVVLLFFRLRPDLIVGFGSFGSAPGVLCGALFRTPILLHEQNVRMGRANRFFSRFASRIAVSFPGTENDPLRQEYFWSGYPLRSSFLKEVSHDDVPSQGLDRPFTILVFGGSQGASRLNEIFMAALALLDAEERRNFAVIHIVGNHDTEELKSQYRAFGIHSEVHSFSHQISKHYKDANLVIARAGAGTIFELAALGRAAILVPYPHAYAHQRFNAEYLVQNRAAVMIEDSRLTPKGLLDEINRLKSDSRARLELERNIKLLFKPNANQALAKTAWELICKQN